MIGAYFVRGLHVRDAHWWRKGKEEETAPFDGPAEDVALKVFHLGRCSPYSVSDSGQDARITDAYMSGLHTRQ